MEKSLFVLILNQQEAVSVGKRKGLHCQKISPIWLRMGDAPHFGRGLKRWEDHIVYLDAE